MIYVDFGDKDSNVWCPNIVEALKYAFQNAKEKFTQTDINIYQFEHKLTEEDVKFAKDHGQASWVAKLKWNHSVWDEPLLADDFVIPISDFNNDYGYYSLEINNEKIDDYYLKYNLIGNRYYLYEFEPVYETTIEQYDDGNKSKLKELYYSRNNSLSF